MLIFESVKWQNFLSTGNMMTEVCLNSHNNTLICGINGSGKSTIIDAITFSLFGKSFRNVNKPQLINSTTTKNMLVEIEFTSNGNKYLVRRGMKPTIFEIYQNGTLLNQSAESKDYQTILEKTILKMNYKSFCQVVVLGSANFTPFMLLPAAQRRNFVEDLLDIQIFSTMNNLLKEKVSENKNAITDCDINIKLLENTLDINRKHREKVSQDTNAIIQQKENQIDLLLTENDGLNQQLTILSGKISELEKKLNRVRPKVKSDLDKAYKMRMMLESKSTSVKKAISFFEDNYNCPTCEQEITVEFKNTKIQSLEAKKTETESIHYELSEKIKKLENKQNDIVSMVSDLQSLSQQNLELTTKINFNNRSVFSYKKDIDDLMNQQKSIVDDKDVLNDLYSVKENKELLLNKRELYNVGLMLLKDGGIKTKIVKQYIPVINDLINKYLEQMEFFCHFSMDETFEEKIKSRYRDDFSFESFSEGEKMRLNLAILFTWRELAKMRNSAATNLLILDEIMDSSLDSSGTEEFIKIISSLTKNNNVFVISHKTDQIIDRFDNVIKFEKVKNFSKIIE